MPKKDAVPDKDSESKHVAEPVKDSESKEDPDSEKDSASEEKTESRPQGTAKVKITISGKEDTEESLSKLQKDITEGKVMIVSAAGSAFGDNETSWVQINGETAYCLENQNAAAFTGEAVSSLLDSNENLRKVLYYGYGGKGDLTGEALSGKSKEEKYVYTHIAANVSGK